MDTENYLKELKEACIEIFTREGYTEVEAIETFEIFVNSYKNSLAKLYLPGVVSNYTNREIINHLKASGEYDKITETALNRLASIK